MTEAEGATLTQYLQSVLSKANCKTNPDPGRVTLRRLNREEYNNTIRDLVGIDFRPADDFPSDDVGYGFDNIGDVLTLPPLLMEKYLAAAEAIADHGDPRRREPAGPTRRFKPAELAKKGDRARRRRDQDSGILMFTNAEVGHRRRRLPQVGHLRPPGPGLRPAGRQGSAPAGVPDRRQAGRRASSVKAEEDAPGTFETRRSRSGGAQNSRSPSRTTPGSRRPRPKDQARPQPEAIDWIEVVGPMYSLPHDLPESHRRIIFRKPTDRNSTSARCPRNPRFATRAFAGPRPRPRSTGCRLWTRRSKDGDRFEKGIQLAMQAVLVSPHFLFRVELETRPGGAPRILTRPRARLAALLLPLVAACPTTSCSTWRRRGSCGRAGTSTPRWSGCSRTRSRRIRRELLRPVAPDPQPQARQPRPRPVQPVRRAPPPRDAARGRALLRRRRPRRPADRRLPPLRLHVPQRAAGQALRDRGRQGRAVPPGPPDRRRREGAW